ncbi:MAG: 3-dehydroquinate synthase [Caulobacteraceae bacterium]
MTMRVKVGLGERAYDVVIGSGLLSRAAGLCAPVLRGRRAVIVADEAVASLYAATLAAALNAPVVEIPSGETSKSLAMLGEVTERLIAHGLDRKGVIVAVGGGVTGDLAGFTAASYMRGVDFIQVPTTLLAQVDSSVGGKTGVDTPSGKNLIGAFHQPHLVLADLDTLNTLPDRQMRAGYAEVLKYGLLGDASFFDWLETKGAAVLALEPGALEHAVARCVEMKAAIVAEDEHETTGARALLNLGHTFGHAFEAESGFSDTLLHGEAVAAGCALAYRFSARMGLCSEQDSARASSAISAAGLPSTLADLPQPCSAAKLLNHMTRDKKAEGGRLTLVLARGIGQAFVARDADSTLVRDFLISEGALP